MTGTEKSVTQNSGTGNSAPAKACALTGIAAALHRVSSLVSHILAIMGGAALVCLLVLVCLNAGGRLFDMPIRGAVESSGLLGALVGTLALGYAQIHGNHIAGGVFAGSLPRPLRIVLHELCLLGCCAFFLFCAYEIADIGLFALECGETDEGVGDLFPYFVLGTVPGYVGQSFVLFCSFLQTLLTGREE